MPGAMLGSRGALRIGQAVLPAAGLNLEGNVIPASHGLVRTAYGILTETGTHTYTLTLALPAASLIVDIGVVGIALWNSAGAVSLIVGDGADNDGFFTATDLKATDLLAGETNNIEHPGGKAGAYIVSEQRVLYQATARNIIGVVTVASGVGTLGRTLMYVHYGIVGAATAQVLS